MLQKTILFKISAIFLATLVVASATVGVLGATGTLQAPTVEGLENEWGNVTDSASEIETTVVVQNPNPIGAPGVVDLRYTASLNDVELAAGERSDVGLSTGRNELRLSTEVPHDRIADWWVTHVDNGERSTLRIEPSVSIPGYNHDLPGREREVSTDLLGAFRTEGSKTVSVRGEPMLTLSDQRASWGDATAERSPIVFSTDVTNEHSHPISFDRIGYTMRMNDVVVGNGTSDGLRVDAGATKALSVDAALETQAMAEWWPTHLRNGERSRMVVDLYGVVERSDSNRTARVPLYDRTVEFETDVLGGGEASVRTVSTGDDRPRLGAPSVRIEGASWGAITESRTEIDSRIAIRTPGDASGLMSLARATVATGTTINGIAVGASRTTLSSLGDGNHSATVTSTLDNSKVPAWWANHLNNGERSTVTTDTNATIDVGFTKFDARLDDRERTFATDLLAGMNGERDQTVTVRGRDLLSVSETHAEWGTATPDEAPLRTGATVTNERRVPITISDVDYTVRLNDVVLANATSPRSYTVAPGETRRLALPMTLDNSKMDEWWVDHLRDGERSELSITVHATVSAYGESERVPLDFLGDNRTVTTDVLGEE